MRMDGDAPLTDADREAIDAFRSDLQMAGQLADRWGLHTFDAMVWLYRYGYLDAVEAPAEADRIVNVESLMDAPEGTVRSGDEFHDPRNWIACEGCGVDCPIESDSCFNCGAALTEDDA